MSHRFSSSSVGRFKLNDRPLVLLSKSAHPSSADEITAGGAPFGASINSGWPILAAFCKGGLFPNADIAGFCLRIFFVQRPAAFTVRRCRRVSSATRARPSGGLAHPYPPTPIPTEAAPVFAVFRRPGISAAEIYVHRHRRGGGGVAHPFAGY